MGVRWTGVPATSHAVAAAVDPDAPGSSIVAVAPGGPGTARDRRSAAATRATSSGKLSGFVT